jgi:hypothetical protein
MDNGKSPVETACGAPVIGAVRGLCEFSLHVGQHYYSDPFHTALENALKRFYKKKGAF